MFFFRGLLDNVSDACGNRCIASLLLSLVLPWQARLAAEDVL